MPYILLLQNVDDEDDYSYKLHKSRLKLWFVFVKWDKKYKIVSVIQNKKDTLYVLNLWIISKEEIKCLKEELSKVTASKIDTLDKLESKLKNISSVVDKQDNLIIKTLKIIDKLKLISKVSIILNIIFLLLLITQWLKN